MQRAVLPLPAAIDGIRPISSPTAGCPSPGARTPADSTACEPASRPVTRSRACADEPLARAVLPRPRSVAVDESDLTTFNRSEHGAGDGNAQALPEKFEKEHGVKIGFMSFLVSAVARVKKYPIINASVDGQRHRLPRLLRHRIAVGSPRGLVVPICAMPTR